VTYDISLVPPRLQHMPPAALALAILLHVLIGAAIWIAPLQPAEPEDQPIMVMFDSTPTNVGLQAPEKAGPPAESTAASPQLSTEPQREERQQQALAPPQPPTAPEQPRPSPPSEAKPQPEQVPSLPIFEFSVPPAPEPLLARLREAAGATSAASTGAACATAAAPPGAAGAATATVRGARGHAVADARTRSGGCAGRSGATAQ
jgi:hypothetical protein